MNTVRFLLKKAEAWTSWHYTVESTFVVQEGDDTWLSATDTEHVRKILANAYKKRGRHLEDKFAFTMDIVDGHVVCAVLGRRADFALIRIDARDTSQTTLEAAR